MSQSTYDAETAVASVSYLEEVGTTISEPYHAVYDVLASRR